jgi:predicted nuclease of restriction endonuclease-like (RecB) superfamily
LGDKILKYPALLVQAKEIIRQSQYEALKAVNKGLINMYWGLGTLISKTQIRGTHGKSVVEKMASDLRKEFPGISGFSAQNLWYMRQFYLEYSKL